MYEIIKRQKGKMASYLSLPLLVHAWNLVDQRRFMIKAVLSRSNFYSISPFSSRAVFK